MAEEPKPATAGRKIAAPPAPKHVSGHAEFKTAAIELAQSARLGLTILSYDLGRDLYGDSAFVAAVRNLATRHKHAQVRILVHSPEWVRRSGHRLVELMRRLTTFVAMRELPEDKKEIRNELLIADERALLLRESPDDHEAQYYNDSPQLARQWLHRFDQWWESAEPAPGLRQLHT
jgi:hypothetical protein